MSLQQAIRVSVICACTAVGEDVARPTTYTRDPLFGRSEFIEYDINVSGANGSEERPTGGTGGTVEIHLADPSARLDEKDFADAPVLTDEQIVLDGKTERFRCRHTGFGSSITVAGTVTIECKGVFAGQIKGDFSNGPVHVNLILNAEEIGVMEGVAGVTPGQRGVRHAVRVKLAPKETDAHRDGGVLVVRTTAVGGSSPRYIKSRILANGGNGREQSDPSVKSTSGGRGGDVWVAGPCVTLFTARACGGGGRFGGTDPQIGSHGGDGGRISIHAQAFYADFLDASGGPGGLGKTEYQNEQKFLQHAGNGGKGGNICVVTESIVKCLAQASGGQGGGISGPPLMQAGTGGDGGTIYLEASQWWDTKEREVGLIADGGAAGDGVKGYYWNYPRMPPPVDARIFSGQNGGKGGTIEVVHNEKPLHIYPKGVMHRFGSPSVDDHQEVVFSAVPFGMTPAYGPHSKRKVLFAALGGSGGAGNVGMSFEGQDTMLGTNGGNGGPGGVVRIPEEWAGSLQHDVLLDGARGGLGGLGEHGRYPTSKNPDGGDGAPGGNGGHGGSQGLINGQASGKAGDGGSGGQGGGGGPPYSVKHSGGKGGNGGKGGDAGGDDGMPGQGGKGGSGGNPRDNLHGEDGQPGGVGGSAPEPQEVWAEVMPFNTAAAIALDYNRDGEISFGPDDRPTKDKPFIFWINDDRDVRKETQLAIPVEPPPTIITDFDQRLEGGANGDADEPGISSPRDLEDFTRLWVQGSGGADKSGAPIQYRLSLESLEGSPAMNVFMAENEEGNLDYLTNKEAALRQIDGTHENELGRVSNTEKSEPLPTKNDGEQPRWCLIFEGAGTGLAAVTVETLKDGKPVAKSEPLYLRLLKIESFYETWTVGDLDVAGVPRKVPPRVNAVRLIKMSHEAEEAVAAPDYFMFVHGWNMNDQSKKVFANTAFKRLWHQGYKGRFGAFRWPTYYQRDDWWDYAWAAEMDFWNYDNSEYNAWHSGKPLADLVRQISATHTEDGGTRLHLYAHSMGNVVAGECLRKLGPSSRDVHTYIAAQGAVSAHAWDATTPKRTGANRLNNLVPPDVHGYYWKEHFQSLPVRWENEGRLSYFHRSRVPVGTRYINHCNLNDYALDKWQINEFLKPGSGYKYSDEAGFRDESGKTMQFPDDTFKVFAFAAESHSLALGQELKLHGSFWSTVDLSKHPFYFGADREDHSGQFNFTIQERWEYWKQVIKNIKAGEAQP